MKVSWKIVLSAITLAVGHQNVVKAAGCDTACDSWAPGSAVQQPWTMGTPSQGYSGGSPTGVDGSLYGDPSASDYSNAGNYPTYSNSPSSVADSASSGGLGDFGFISGSLPGDSFAAAAPGSYIDNAVVANMFRFRFDAAYNNPLPDRAEFFYGQCGCFGGNAPGPVLEENEVDYQEFRPYLERAVSRNFSLFVETPFRLINPDINANTGGLSDINTGFKYALYNCDRQYLTSQLRVYTPTGDADRGLGTGHVSIEPGLLYLGQQTDRLIFQGEFAVWVPISDSTADTRTANDENFAGTVLRYGLGAGYDILNLDSCCERRRLSATFETVGWTITDGLAFGGANNLNVLNVGGDTIVNLKPGIRYTAGLQSIAASYGVAVTGDRWYSDIGRLEYRVAY